MTPRARLPWRVAVPVVLLLCPLAGVGLAAIVAAALNAMGWR